MKKLILLMTAVLTGCSSLDNPCNDQGAGQCASVTTAYQNSLKNSVSPADLPRGQSVDSINSRSSSSSNDDLVLAYTKQQSYSQIPQAGSAMRTSPQSMRVWILPYEDDAGLYHDQQYVYALVHKGVWKYKSTSLKNTANPYINTYADSVSSSKYQPFTMKESDPISNNQALISPLANPASSSTAQNPSTSPFSADAIASKNSAILNSVSGTSSTGN